MKTSKKSTSVSLQVSGVTRKPKKKTNGIHPGALPMYTREKVWEIGHQIPPVPEDLPEPQLSETALYVGKTRYAIRDERSKPVESAKDMFWRVAFNIAVANLQFDPMFDKTIALAKQFYLAMASQKFIPNTPTMLNAGRPMQQLSACFVLPIEDDMRSIAQTLVDMVMIHKSGGGTGFSFSKLRPYGDTIGSSGGTTVGPTAFLQAYNDVTSQVKQGGVRRGANMGILNITHPDILRFAVMKVDEFSMTNFNISVAVTEDWMEKVKTDSRFVMEEPDWEEIIEGIKQAQAIRDVDLKLKKVEEGVAKLYELVRARQEGEGYELVNPRTGLVMDRLNAKKVFLLITQLAWHYGDPGMIMIDRINNSNANPTPSLGQIESTNPCVTADTWVYTSEGSRQVGNLIAKPFMARVNGQHYLSTHNGFFSTGKKKVFSLRTKEGYSLRLTANHKVKKVEKFTRYDIDSDWVEAQFLKRGDKIVLNNHRADSNWPGKYCFDEGYLIGLLIGDGTLKKDKAVLSVWHPGTTGSGAVMSEVTQMVQSISLRSETSKWVVVKGRNEYRLSAAKIKHLAHELGMYPGGKIITPYMEQASGDFCKGLLKGLFDTDGSVQGSQKKGVSVRLAQSDLSCLFIVQRILLRLGIVSTIYKNRRNDGFRRLPNGKGGEKEYFTKAQHELVVSGDNLLVFKEMVGFMDSKKATRLRELLGNYKRVLNRERFVATVEMVEEDGTEEVYDVQIPTVRAFDANGIMTHNCGEQPLLPYDACTLGAVNVGKFVRDGAIDWEGLGETVKIAVNFLDNVLDMNNYPIAAVNDMTRKIRRIGLGMMGFADMLVQLQVGYNTDEGLKVAEEVMKFIDRQAKVASLELARERGTFLAWEGSIYDPKSPYFRGQNLKLRNGALTTIAPTGTTAMLADASSGIEPYFGVAYVKNTIEGKRLFNTNPFFLEVAKSEGFYSDELLEKIDANHGSVRGIPEVPIKWQEVFVVAHDIEPERHIGIQAAFQKHVDNAISKTINFPHEATVEDVRKVYMMVYETGCKGVTIYRDGSREKQILETKKEGSYYDQMSGAVKPESPAVLEEQKVTEDIARERPMILRGRTYKINTPVGEAFVTINRDNKDNPFEVFVTIGKAGMHTSADAEALGRMISLALRVSRGDSRHIAKKIVSQLRGIGGSSQIGFGKERVMSLADAIAKALAEELSQFGVARPEGSVAETIPLNLTITDHQENGWGGENITIVSQDNSGPAKMADLCPECGNATFVFEEGCKKCHGCGYSAC